ncbi:HAD family hydrolase [Actinacidiphila sp. ITFR-21]|uniref:HAD family hydrolase n=1 Tax=Actinacidiphila sp. ITFR-21 TaxID=3075199 RepID=UPI00288A3C4E|nr:HAD family hydrolase [Streptomyces sp. ITFR-21]WNI15730.1 HAD family hydrolase [Streptomyces sp. ITFR-21]
MGNEALEATISTTRGVLFDFDGPICDVFAGLPASEVARDLVAILRGFEPTLAASASEIDDPMEILRLASKGSEATLRAVEDALTSAEGSAVKVAGNPIPGAVAALRAAQSSGHSIAVVSNNSAGPIWAFLHRHGLTPMVREVVGRAPYRPDLMKPDPYSLALAASRLDLAPTQCTLIGDSVTDIEAARATGAKSIGYANKSGKARSLTEAGADAIVSDMSAVADAFCAAP